MSGGNEQRTSGQWGSGGRGPVLFGVLGITEAATGLWAQVLPRSFYDSFPGFGWHWVAAAGAYDEHLVRDFGGLSLALAAVSLAAAWRPMALALPAFVAWEVWAVPHLVFHAAHTDGLPAVQNAAQLTTLSLTVVGPAMAAALVSGASGPGRRRRADAT